MKIFTNIVIFSLLFVLLTCMCKGLSQFAFEVLFIHVSGPTKYNVLPTGDTYYRIWFGRDKINRYARHVDTPVDVYQYVPTFT